MFLDFPRFYYSLLVQKSSSVTKKGVDLIIFQGYQMFVIYASKGIEIIKGNRKICQQMNLVTFEPYFSDFNWMMTFEAHFDYFYDL